jgi:hypothetical protein
MLQREGELIRRYRPEWNRVIPLEDGKLARNMDARNPRPAA